jgi:hypothetical protein
LDSFGVILAFKGYGGKNKKISPFANSRLRLSGNVSWLIRALLHALPVTADAVAGTPGFDQPKS